MTTATNPSLPTPVDSLSEAVCDFLMGRTDHLPAPWQVPLSDNPDWNDSDFQRALWMLQIVEIDRFEGVDPDRILLRGARDLHQELVDLFLHHAAEVTRHVDATDLHALVADLRADTGAPTLPSTESAVRHRLCAKAPYLGWEADAHTLALARLPQRLKRIVAEIQSGEYGVGFDLTHAEIYRNCLSEIGTTLDAAVDQAPAAGFALANSALCFAARPRYLGAAIGQLCAFELDSVAPCCHRIQEWNSTRLPSEGRRWYDVHVLADAEHASIVTDQLLPQLRDCDPDLVDGAVTGIVVTQQILAELADLAAHIAADGSPTIVLAENPTPGARAAVGVI